MINYFHLIYFFIIELYILKLFMFVLSQVSIDGHDKKVLYVEVKSDIGRAKTSFFIYKFKLNI